MSDFKQKLKEARIRVNQMDAMDGHQQIDLGVLSMIRTCKQAIECGISVNDEKSIMDAYVMLEQAERALSPALN